MAKFYIAIVSHGHDDYLINNKSLKLISSLSGVSVLIKDNVSSGKLKVYCNSLGYHYVESAVPVGFGENNNSLFSHAKCKLGLMPEDWFIIINPDVQVELEYFEKLINELKDSNKLFFAPNLFKDSRYTEPESSLRKFASYKSLFNPFFLKPINTEYDKSKLDNFAIIEWASGAFLCIKSKTFSLVSGFDESYFMYYEDVDLCYRLREIGVDLYFLKEVKAVHKGQYKNRSFFSKHFLWYISSLFKFLNIQNSSGSKFE